MFSTKSTVLECAHCSQANEISMKYFVGSNDKFHRSVLITCEHCKKGFYYHPRRASSISSKAVFCKQHPNSSQVAKAVELLHSPLDCYVRLYL